MNKTIAFIKEYYAKVRNVSTFSVLATICCFLTLKPIASSMGWSVVTLLYVICFLCSQQFKDTIQRLKEYINNKYQFFWGIVLGTYIAFSLTGMFFLEADYRVQFSCPIVYYIPFIMIWLTPVICKCYLLFFCFFDSCMGNEGIISVKTQILAICFLMVYYGIWLYAFNPCISSYDTSVLYYQAHVMGEVGMVNWHPPFYAIILSFLLKICDSAIFLILVQCLYFAIIFVRGLAFLRNMGISKRVINVLYFLIGFSFQNAILLVTLWKDIPYMVSILWLTILIIKIVLKEDLYGNSKIWYFEFILAAVFTAFFRQNGILPVVIVCGLLPIVLRKHIRMTMATCLFICLFWIIQVPVYAYYQVTSAPGLKFFAMANDITGSYYDGKEVSEDVMDIVEEIEAGLPDGYVYNPYYTGYNSDALHDYSILGFLEIYCKAFLDNPKTMLLNFLRRTSVIWSICRPDKETTFGIYLEECHLEGYEQYTYPVRKNNFLTETLTEYSKIILGNTLVYVFAERTAIYLLAIFISVFCLWIKGVKKLKWYMPYIPVFMNTIALIIGSGWTDYRYYWPTAMICPFLLIYTAIAIRAKENNRIKINTLEEI